MLKTIYHKCFIFPKLYVARTYIMFLFSTEYIILIHYNTSITVSKYLYIKYYYS